MRLNSIPKATVATAALMVTAIALIGNADAKDGRARYECRANGSDDISMSARYELRDGQSGRRKFSTEFEAGPPTNFEDGQRLIIVVDDVKVGRMKLEQLVDGDLVGDLNFDTRRQVDAVPFPSNWPGNVGQGSTVDIKKRRKTVLGCEMG